MISISKQFLFALLLVLGTISCSKDENTEPEDNTCKPIIMIDDDIDEYTIWDSTNVYLINESRLWVTATLEILPGTVIKMKDQGLVEVLQQGVINAKGTDEHPIVFTSIHDDNHGCDDNNNGTATKPEKEDWTTINISTNGNVFEHCKFLYSGYKGGINNYSAIRLLNEQTITVKNCTFAHGVGKIDVFPEGVLDVLKAGSQSQIQNNIFYNNNLPLSVNPCIDLGTGNTFFNPNNPAEGNTMNAIFINEVFPDADPIVFVETEVPFVFLDGMYVTDAFEINEGVIVKVSEGEFIIRNEYNNNADKNGTITIANSAVFTSYKDDSYGGDSNDDGTASQPNKGDWIGINDPQPNDRNYFISGANILYAEKP